MSDNFRRAIEPKSDQLNAEQLVGGPITIKVTSVEYNFSADQKMIIHYEGENGRPYKPSKGMMKLIGSENAWGPDEDQWVGRSMTLYRDPNVKFGKEETGGIRVSHLSHIRGRLTVTIMVSRGKYQKYIVNPLTVQGGGDNSELEVRRKALQDAAMTGDMQELAAAWGKIPKKLQAPLADEKEKCKQAILAAQQAEPQGFNPATPDPAPEPQEAPPEPPAKTTTAPGDIDKF